MQENSFTIFPAIDLRQGKVVRLSQGDPARQTTYDSDPAAAARRWLAAGARWLHVVNLDGAFGETDTANHMALEVIVKAAKQAGAQVQFGGGLRTMAAFQKAVETGVSRVVLGTAAVEQPELVNQAMEQSGPDRVAVGLDVRDGFVQVHGWAEGTSIQAGELASRFRSAGLHWLIFTDVARDGLETGLNLQATRSLAENSGLQVIASGGVRNEEDVRSCREAGLAGVIVGRALYEGKIDLAALLQELRGEEKD